MYYTYIIQSKKTNKLYVGYSADLEIRIQQHNKGEVRATKNGKPWKLIYYEACLDKKDAVKREKQLKTGFGRAYLKRRLSSLQ